MKRSSLLALAAVLLYATQNVLLEQKLAKYSTPALLLIFYLVMAPLAGLRLWYLSASGQGVNFPIGTGLGLAVFAGLMYFAADYCFVGAYTSGGDLLTITTIVILFPVAASIAKYLWVGELPTIFQVAGYLLAIVAVWLVIKGSPIPTVELAGN